MTIRSAGRNDKEGPAPLLMGGRRRRRRKGCPAIRNKYTPSVTRKLMTAPPQGAAKHRHPKSRHVEPAPHMRHSEPKRKLRSSTWTVPEGILLRPSTIKTKPKRTKMPSRTCYHGLRNHISAQHDALENPNVPRCLRRLAFADCVTALRLSMTLWRS